MVCVRVTGREREAKQVCASLSVSDLSVNERKRKNVCWRKSKIEGYRVCVCERVRKRKKWANKRLNGAAQLVYAIVVTVNVVVVVDQKGSTHKH